MFRQLCSSMVTLKFSGHLKTTWTTFCPILTTCLPIVDFCGHLVHYLPFVPVDIEKSPYPLAYLNLFIEYNFQVYFGLPTNHKDSAPSVIRRRQCDNWIAHGKGLRSGILGSFLFWLSTSRSQVVIKKSANDNLFYSIFTKTKSFSLNTHF